MRRTTTLSPSSDNMPPRSSLQKSRTFVTDSKKPPPQLQMRNNFIHSHQVARTFIQQTLINKCMQEMQRRQLPRLINEAVKQCDFYLKYQAWQIDSKGPYKQKVQQSSLQPDKQPQCIIIDPLLAFNKTKNNTKKSLRNTLSLLTLTSRKQSDRNNKSPFTAHHLIDRKQSTLTNTTSKPSKIKFTTSTSNLNLIPLRFQNGITPELTSRRTLEDFLREKKKTMVGNTGHGIPSFPSEKDSLKVVTEIIPKSNFFTSTTTTKNFQSFNQHDKFPQIFPKQQLNTDYDGKAIQIKKLSNLSKPTHVLKMVYKLKQENNNGIRKQYLHPKYLSRPQQIKLKPINQRKHTTNNNIATSLTFRLNEQGDVKSLVQDGLYTNRIKFRYQQDNYDT